MSVKPVAWMHVAGGSTVTDATREGMDKVGKRQYSIPLYSAPAPELAGGLRTYIAHYPAFRSKPVGAPGSQAREKQEYEIALENEAVSLLARITPK